MKTRRFIQAAIAVSILIAFSASQPGFAGDLTADNITACKDVSVYGSLNMSGPLSNSIPTNGLVMYYTFDTNSSMVADQSGNNNTGTVYDATWTSSGKVNGAFNYDGVDDYVDTHSSTLISGTNDFTLSGWMKATSDVNNILAGTSGGTQTEQFGLFSGAMGLWASSSFVMSISLGSMDLTQWHHYAWTRSGNTWRVYVDGVQVGSDVTDSRSLATPATTFKIGTMGDTGGQFLAGSADEVMVHNFALSAQQIYNAYLYGAGPSTNSSTLSVSVDAAFQKGVRYTSALGDISMGVYTNTP